MHIRARPTASHINLSYFNYFCQTPASSMYSYKCMYKRPVQIPSSKQVNLHYTY